MRANFVGCLTLVGWQLVAACGASAPRLVAPSGSVSSGAEAPREMSSHESSLQEEPKAARNDQTLQGYKESAPSSEHDDSPPVSESFFAMRRRGGEPTRDYAIRVGIGFTEEEEELLRRAAETWARATGLPLHLRGGYGPLGNFHIAEAISVCGQRWVYDGYLGCYSPEFDSVVLNRPGLDLWVREEADILFIVLLHEIGHFLGLSHASEGEDSVMLPDYPTLARRPGELGALSARDVRAVCRVNPCQIE